MKMIITLALAFTILVALPVSVSAYTGDVDMQNPALAALKAHLNEAVTHVSSSVTYFFSSLFIGQA